MLSGRKDRRELPEMLRRMKNDVLCRTAAAEGRRNLKALDLVGSL